MKGDNGSLLHGLGQGRRFERHNVGHGRISFVVVHKKTKESEGPWKRF